MRRKEKKKGDGEEGEGGREGGPYPQPWGVTTPKKQSPLALSTTWSDWMGVMTMPAAARRGPAEARRSHAKIFIVVVFSSFNSLIILEDY